MREALVGNISIFGGFVLIYGLLVYRSGCWEMFLILGLFLRRIGCRVFFLGFFRGRVGLCRGFRTTVIEEVVIVLGLVFDCK